MDAIDKYMEAYTECKSLEAELKRAKEAKSRASEKLLQHLSENGLSSVGRGDQTLTVSQTAYSKVDNYDTLRAWVDGLNEPRGEYMSEVFQRRRLNEMVREALKESVTTGKVELPPGLGHYVQNRITVRQHKRKDTIATSATEMLADTLEDIDNG